MVSIKKIKILPSSNPAEKNTIFLEPFEWDDYGYNTTLGVVFCNNNGERISNKSLQIYCVGMDEGNVGFANKVYIDNYLPDGEIDQLPDGFCSLGVDISYYTELKATFPDEYMNILRRLNDLAYSKDLWEKFRNCAGVKKSLLRYSSSSKALAEAYETIEKKPQRHSNLSFDYSTDLPYCKGNYIELRFNFNSEGILPYRINAIVGKNGTGKTQLLSKLAEAISGFNPIWDWGSQFGTAGRPPFDKVISISYSAFDPFKKIKGSLADKGYVYCGIQSESGTLKIEEMEEVFAESYRHIIDKDRLEIWERVISELFRGESEDIVNQIKNITDESHNWSSGQHILIYSMTEVIAKIDRESIVLFDEPEIHLHPNAIANVMRMLNKLLEEFDSYAIIATHSPIILQEVPACNVTVIERIDNQPFVRGLTTECFGENVTKITRDVFGVTAEESFYQSYFIHLKDEGYSQDQIEALFDNKLGMNASIFLEGIFRGNGQL